MLSSTVLTLLLLSTMLTNTWTTACTVVMAIIFSSIPVHLNRKVTMALKEDHLFFVGQGSVAFYGSAFRHLAVSKKIF